MTRLGSLRCKMLVDLHDIAGKLNSDRSLEAVGCQASDLLVMHSERDSLHSNLPLLHGRRKQNQAARARQDSPLTQLLLSIWLPVYSLSHPVTF